MSTAIERKIRKRTMMTTSMTKIVITIMITLFSANIALCMENAQCQPWIEMHRKNDCNHNSKLLEHACFRGKPLRFQNQFFLSPYKRLPKELMEVVDTVVVNSELEEYMKEDMMLRSIFLYHQQYRQDCYDLLKNAQAYISEIKIAYTKENFPHRSLSNVMNPYVRLFNGMSQAWKINNYPVLMSIANKEFIPLVEREYDVVFRVHA